jgi:hypothetical protein
MTTITETIDLAEVRDEIKHTIAAVKEAARQLPDGEVWWNLGHASPRELEHIRANLNSALLHLTDATGC